MIQKAELLESLRLNRCGVIPWCNRRGHIHYLLTRHTESKELGDFGGCIRQTETGLQGGFLEFIEESRGIFLEEYPSELSLRDKPVLISDGMAVIFAEVSANWYDKANMMFHQSRTGKKCSDEVSELVWVDERMFTKMIYSYTRPSSVRPANILWKRVQLFFRKSLASKTSLSRSILIGETQSAVVVST